MALIYLVGIDFSLAFSLTISRSNESDITSRERPSESTDDIYVQTTPPQLSLHPVFRTKIKSEEERNCFPFDFNWASWLTGKLASIWASFQLRPIITALEELPTVTNPNTALPLDLDKWLANVEKLRAEKGFSLDAETLNVLLRKKYNEKDLMSVYVWLLKFQHYQSLAKKELVAAASDSTLRIAIYDAFSSFKFGPAYAFTFFDLSRLLHPKDGKYDLAIRDWFRFVNLCINVDASKKEAFSIKDLFYILTNALPESHRSENNDKLKSNYRLS
ncbi:uncharacterized protein CCR75_000226 [Bremia lactucae]|uniref:RXLR phytopathogen effector protein WY-domain domain-containing protein n=1 Tax=Bremia lactucae TaxID=4779 RepID=A0A976FEH7_BRELC|nr:hypothetical protein CCR75_000226 [Bremia lactucae]